MTITPVELPAGALIRIAPVEIAVVQAPDADPVSVYLAQLAPTSRRAVRHDLDVIAGMLSGEEADAQGIPWHLLRYPNTAAIRQQLAERYAPTTANRMLSSLRGVLREAWNLELVSAEDFHRAVSIRAVKGSRLPAGRALTAGEIRALFTTCAEDPRPAGVRDAAMLAVLYGAGVRRAELVQMDVSDYEMETGAVRVRSGKGNKDRITYVQGMGCTAVEVWIAVRGPEPGSLFAPIHRSGKIQMRALREQSVYDMLQRRATEAGVPPFSPHDLRRTFAGDLLDAGADISTVQKLMGHASVNTTQGYDRRGEATKRKAAGLLHIPYARPG
ncbi:MAG TPA: tyrosine-type recombinase/integrase [Longimicrobiaceae bacterium]|nr:tyrosine-type recombinase/integrase [Longimicrobiaceae bacterium]